MRDRLTALKAMAGAAEFSECGNYRTRLLRRWLPEGNPVLFILLNPSTADADTDDPTVCRCIRFAARWGYGAMEVRNLFAYRATQPGCLLQVADPIGPNNVLLLRDEDVFSKVVIGWGNHGAAIVPGRDGEVLHELCNSRFRVFHFGLTRAGNPKHPLYLPSGSELRQLYPARAIPSRRTTCSS